MRRLNQKGYNLVELVIAIGILSAMASSVMLARSFMTKQTVATTDKGYATQKAIQMFEELKALVNGNEKAGVNVLDQYTDGSKYNMVLTTDNSIDIIPLPPNNPGDPLSGNRLSNGHWRYVRQIQVNRLANDPYTRQVIIKIWLNGSESNTNPQPGLLLAEVGGLLRTITNVFPPTQVMDIYVLAINNIAGWWAQEPVLYNTYQGIVQDIQGRNPGLEIRPHYITRASYGRDITYAPYINNTLTTDSVANGGNIPYVYFYPGSTKTDNVAPDTGATGIFYDPLPNDPGFAGLCGNLNVDGTLNPTTGFFPGNTCPSYAMADMYNNAMRYPDELALYQAVTTAGAAAVPALPPADSVTEMSERMLFENMNSNPASFTNALLVNLHGELLPLPSMRNYSDAAKDPGNWPNIRVVTHPEMLYYPGATSTTANVNVNLRVYAYYDGLDDISQLTAIHPDNIDPKTNISLFFPDLSTANTSIVGVTAIIGNSNTCAVPVTYSYDAFTGPYPAGTTLAGSLSAAAGDKANTGGQGPVSFLVQSVGANNQLLISLFNTRIRAPNGYSTVGGGDLNGGLDPTDRLYGLEYIPCSPEKTALTSPVTFTTQDLVQAGAAGTPKNTARWLITLSMPVTSTFAASGGSPLTIMTQPANQVYTSPVTFIGMHTIETRIGAGASSNNSVHNMSRTYVWTGWASPPPATERFQFQGDPRHEPYLDVKVGGISNGQPTVIQSNGYNWYFKDGANPSVLIPNMYNDGYRGFGKAGDTNGWSGSDANFVDLPRFYQVVRQGLLNTTGIWTTMNGYSYYYYGLGGEFGSDQPPFQQGLTINTTLYNTTRQTTNSTVSEIINYQGAINTLHVVSNTTNTWFAKTWLGELYPDSMTGSWDSGGVGNLPVATGAASNSTFYRVNWNALANNLGAISNNPGKSLYGLGRNVTNRAGPQGCTSFYNGSGGGGQMNHGGNSNGTDTLTSLGVTTYMIYQYPLAPNVVSGNLRPWHISDGQIDPEWNIAPYNAALRTTLSLPAIGGLARSFYSSDSGADWQATAIVQLTDPAGKVAYVLESGLAIAANVGTNELGKTALDLELRSFLDGGLYPQGTASHIVQVPLVAVYVDSPNNQYSNPSNINIVVDGAVTTGIPLTIAGFATIGSGPTPNVWLRFPGMTANMANFYTEEYPGYASGNVNNSTYNELIGGLPVTLDLNLKYSNNGGANWYYLQDNNPAVNGVLSTVPAELISSASFPVTYQWPVPAGSFPGGDYFIRAEAYREGFTLDYSYHMLDIAINR